jgi:hypothetical protein
VGIDVRVESVERAEFGFRDQATITTPHSGSMPSVSKYCNRTTNLPDHAKPMASICKVALTLFLNSVAQSPLAKEFEGSVALAYRSTHMALLEAMAAGAAARQVNSTVVSSVPRWQPLDLEGASAVAANRVAYDRTEPLPERTVIIADHSGQFPSRWFPQRVESASGGVSGGTMPLLINSCCASRCHNATWSGWTGPEPAWVSQR